MRLPRNSAPATLWGLSLLCAVLTLCLAQVASGAGLSRLPASDYTVHGACAAPEPGRASCLALEFEPRTAAAHARVHRLSATGSPQPELFSAAECANYPSTCLTPEDLRSAYFPSEEPLAPESQPQTIALVDAYNDLNAEADINVYAKEFGLPTCTAANSCFKQLNEDGNETPSSLPFPRTKAELESFSKGTTQEHALAEEAEGWALETATDIEVAHAVCRNCHILLVEAGSTGYHQLDTAEDTAATLGATEISNSWGGEEEDIALDNPAFNHPRIVITAAAGDDGYMNWDQYAGRHQTGSPYFEGTDYPASSPHVVSVGGTRLNLGAGGVWQSEAAWNGNGAGGGGCGSLPAPAWQRQVSDWAGVGCGEDRASTDVSAVADPSTGVDVYDSTPYPYEEKGKKLAAAPHWLPIGGTSVASPVIASMFALAGGAQGVEYPAKTLYEHLGTPLLHDVSTGGNGECDDEYAGCSGSMNPLSPFFPLDCGQGTWICNTTSGYDGPTGVGTPNGIDVFKTGEGSDKSGEEGKATNKGSEEGQPEGGSPKGGGNPGGGSEPPVIKTVEEATSPAGSGFAGQPAGGDSPETPGDQPTSLTVTPSDTKRTPRISALALTANARVALSHGGLLGSGRLAFSFRLNVAASVRVSLARSLGSGNHQRWIVQPISLTFSAIRGLNRRRLHGSSKLRPGLYRLRLLPSGGTARSIQIRVP